MNLLQRLRRVMDGFLGGVCAALLFFMVLVGTYQIASRYFLNRPSTVSEELLTYSFTWLSLFAASYVFGKREHMRMGFFADRLAEKYRVALEIFVEVICLAFALVVMVYGGIAIMRLTMSQKTASLGIPMGMVYAAVPLTGSITAVYIVLNILSLFQKRKEKERGKVA